MKNLHYLYLLIVSIFITTLCSDTSPLYHFNPSPDPSIFFISGRAFREGFIPYVEFADTKGLLLIYIYSLSTYISNSSFTGIYIIQCFLLFVTLAFAQKTAKIYVSENGSFVAALSLCIFLLNSYPYQRGGGAEELLWPFMSALVYCLARYFSGKDATFSKWLYLSIGITAGASFMIKYSVTLPIIILFIAVLAYEWKRVELKKVLQSALWALCGASIIIVPCIIHLWFMGALQAFADEYILTSARYGTTGQQREWYVHLLRPMPVRSLSDLLMWIALIWGVKSHGFKSILRTPPLMFIILLYLLYKGETISYYNHYYNSINSPLMIACCIFFVSKAEEKKELRKNKVLCIAAIILTFMTAGTQFHLFGAVEKGHFAWKESAHAPLYEALSTRQDKKILYLGWLDRGFGIPCNWRPCGRYWFLQNSPSDSMRAEQMEYIRQGKPDIIHTYSKEFDDLFQKSGYSLFYTYKGNYFYERNKPHQDTNRTLSAIQPKP